MSLSARALFPLVDLGLGTETAAAADTGFATAPVCCAVLDLVVLADAGFEAVASEVAFLLGGMVGIWSKAWISRGIYKGGDAIQKGQSRRAAGGLSHARRGCAPRGVPSAVTETQQSPFGDTGSGFRGRSRNA